MSNVARLRPTCPCGCYHPPGTPCPTNPCQPGGNQMPMGVTDGSNALPGQVGEWFTANATITFGTSPISTTVTLGTLPAGDWNVWSGAQINPGQDIALRSLLFLLNPLPAGFQNTVGQSFSTETDVAENMVFAGVIARANTTVPTALVYQVAIEGDGTGSGSITLYFNGRRMR